MSNTDHPFDVLKNLDVTLPINDGEMVTDALVLVKIVNLDGGVNLRVSWSNGMSWIERLGMLHAAEILERPQGGYQCTCDDHEGES